MTDYANWTAEPRAPTNITMKQLFEVHEGKTMNPDEYCNYLIKRVLELNEEKDKLLIIRKRLTERVEFLEDCMDNLSRMARENLEEARNKWEFDND